jgi:hypothetical protein
MSDTVYPPVVQPPIAYPPESQIVFPPDREVVLPPEPKLEEPPEITPRAVTQSSFVSPRAVEPVTHLRSPLMVGAPGEAGLALLAKRGYFNYTIGTFNGVLVKFSPTSVLLTIYTSILVPFNGTTPTVRYGSTTTGTEFGAAVDLTQAQGTYKLDITKLIYPSYSLYINAILTGATAGEVIITMVYSGTPAKIWQ